MYHSDVFNYRSDTQKTCMFGFYNIEAFNFFYYKATGSPSMMHMTCFDTSNIVLQGREIWTKLFLPGSFTATICVSNLAKNTNIQACTASYWFYSRHYWFWEYWKNSC